MEHHAHNALWTHQALGLRNGYSRNGGQLAQSRTAGLLDCRGNVRKGCPRLFIQTNWVDEAGGSLSPFLPIMHQSFCVWTVRCSTNQIWDLTATWANLKIPRWNGKSSVSFWNNSVSSAVKLAKGTSERSSLMFPTRTGGTLVSIGQRVKGKNMSEIH